MAGVLVNTPYISRDYSSNVERFNSYITPEIFNRSVMERDKQQNSELKARNLSSIQRIDPCAVAILDQATHTALYRFQAETKSWQKTDVDGAMFVYQRADKPFFSVIIANRQSLKDYVEPLHIATHVKQDGKYMFLRKPDGVINGLWFFREDDCSRIVQLLEELKEHMKSGKPPSPVRVDRVPSPVSVPPSSESNQLLEMLCPSVNREGSQSQQSTRRLDSSTVGSSTEEKEKISPGPSQSAAVMGIGDMPVLLQKLMVQEQPSLVCKDLLNSSSAVSLAAMSTRSIQGSEGENDNAETQSMLAVAGELAEPEEADSDQGDSLSSVPLLNKEQFRASLMHLIEKDDTFLSTLHQGYVDALNRRMRNDD